MTEGLGMLGLKGRSLPTPEQWTIPGVVYFLSGVRVEQSTPAGHCKLLSINNDPNYHIGSFPGVRLTQHEGGPKSARQKKGEAR